MKGCAVETGIKFSIVGMDWNGKKEVLCLLISMTYSIEYDKNS